MRKSVLAASAALSLLAATGALAESRSYDLDSFDKVAIATGLTAVITRGESQSLRIETKRNGVLDQIDLDVRNGELRARRHTNLLDIIFSGGLLNMMHFDNDATLYITLPNLSGVSASSGASVEADLIEGEAATLDASSGARIDIAKVEVGTLSLAASSGAGIELAGTCDTAAIEVSSGASIRAGELSCKDVDVDGSSGASASFQAEGRVTGSLSSGASVRLGGTPESVNVESSSGGSLRMQ
ncbi:MAG: DUF2807 domain-containing protein [Alphaproteobacteria bacterium]|nr:DUF2807 domain-containing protein [Alphaproteobacteria bacterium]